MLHAMNAHLGKAIAGRAFYDCEVPRRLRGSG